MRKILIFIFFIITLFNFCHSWGHLGHSAIAQVAYSLLDEVAKQAVDNYIHPFPLAGVAPQPDLYAFTPGGSWSEPFHYLNLARNATGYTNEACPDPPSCVVKAILNYTRILISEGRQGSFCVSEYYPYVYEPCALIFLTHFVGDIHQPLHCGYKDDEGGNLVSIYYYNILTELHYIWDNTMIQNFTRSNINIDILAEGIRTTMKQYPNMVEYYYNNMDVILWANESFNYVRNTCYVFTPNDLEMQQNSFNSIAEKRIEQNLEKKAPLPQLGTWYYERNMQVILQRLTAASVRLAHLLNEIFGTNNGKNVLHLLNPHRF